MRTILKCIAIVGVATTLFTHVSHVITWPNWLHGILTHWQKLFSDFWSETASLIGLDLSTHAGRFLTICAFLILAIVSANREMSINTKSTKLGIATAIVGLTISAAVIVGALIIPIISDKSLPNAGAIYIDSNLITVCVGFAIFLFVIVKRARWQDLARQAWIFLVLFTLMTLIFMGHVIFRVMQEINGRLDQTSISMRTKTVNYAVSRTRHALPFRVRKVSPVRVQSFPGTERCSSFGPSSIALASPDRSDAPSSHFLS